jgi:hypothetical protein
MKTYRRFAIKLFLAHSRVNTDATSSRPRAHDGLKKLADAPLQLAGSANVCSLNEPLKASRVYRPRADAVIDDLLPVTVVVAYNVLQLG